MPPMDHPQDLRGESAAYAATCSDTQFGLMSEISSRKWAKDFDADAERTELQDIRGLSKGV